MTQWKRTLLLLLLGHFISPPIVSATGNIYQDAIPHLKACLSLIQERDTQQAAIDPVDLRAVCPTLSDFLSYEPISEIDPPLENYTSRLNLESLVSLLEASIQPKKAEFPKNIDESGAGQKQFEIEQAHKPFFLALAHWTFFHVQSFLINHTPLTQPRVQHTIYITFVNFVIVICFAAVILYIVMSGRSSQLYLRHFKSKWQKQSAVKESQPGLDDIAGLQLHLQIPALIALIKQRLQQAGILRNAENITNAQLLCALKEFRPHSTRDITRLIRLYDRLKYNGKAAAADEVNLAFELTRGFLTTDNES